jgi:cyclase
MSKTRLIFTLLYDHKNYMLSRNFRLQKVGNLQWVKDNYDFDSILRSIDELVILNVEREDQDINAFCENITELLKECFMPVAIGGGVNSLDKAYKLFDTGSEKIVVNSILYDDPGLVRKLVEIFGGQAVVASIDYKVEKNLAGPASKMVYKNNGSVSTGLNIREALDHIVSLGAGEIYLTSMDKDGTGMGYDIETIRWVSDISPVPIIASGGVGRTDQFSDGILSGKVNALSTANLFNFMSDGLAEARDTLIRQGHSLAVWDKQFSNLR